VIKPNPTRKNLPPFDQLSYKGRHVIERVLTSEGLAPRGNTI
jgi:hypothetical protein